MASLSCSLRSESCKSVVSSSCFACKELRAAFDQVLFQCAAVFHLLDAFALQIFRSFDSGFGGGTVDLRDQNLVIELVNFQSNIVLRLLRFLS